MTTVENNQDFTVPARETDVAGTVDFPPDAEAVSFRDLKLLGMGGMGVVYEADDPALERKVALKMLRAPFRNDSNLVAKFIKEARITAKIDHPNIIAVHHLGMNPECGAYFSMRRIRGETLQAVIRKLRENDPETRRRYTPRRLLDVFVSACNGVAAAHQHGIMHCDLKPSNIMIGSRGEVWVLDWGVAREPGDPPASTVEGTMAFMAPELVSGTIPAPDEKSEVYALGAILYSILCWRDAPFDLALPKEKLARAVASGKYLKLAAPDKSRILQVELCAICVKAMNRDRDKRYANVTELLNDLHCYLDGKPVSAYSPSGFYHLLKLFRRRPLIPVTVMAAVLTLIFYRVGTLYLENAEERYKSNQAYFNMRMAEEYSRRSLMYWNALTSPETSSAPMHVAMQNHSMLLNVNLAMLESFAAFDAVESASDGTVQAFIRNGGGDAIRKLLHLQIIAAPPETIRNTVARCQRRWQRLLEAGVAHDHKLERMIRQISDNCGQLVLSGDEENMQHCTLLRPDGSSQPMSFKKRQLLELPAGDNRLFFTSRSGRSFAAFFRVKPGAAIHFSIPDIRIPDNFVVVPADHWLIPVPGFGEQLKRLPEYLISVTEISGGDVARYLHDQMPQLIAGKALISAETADDFCKVLSREMKNTVRLPGELELRKALSAGNEPGKSFYGAEIPAPELPVFVRKNNGSIGIYRNGKMIPGKVKPDDLAAIRIVIEMKQSNQQ